MEVGEEIRHLDFIPDLEEEKEKDPEEGKRHWVDPIDPNKRWCGSPCKDRGSFTGGGTSSVSEITCHACLHQYINKGPDWWWRVHNLYYGSDCHVGNHVCGK